MDFKALLDQYSAKIKKEQSLLVLISDLINQETGLNTNRKNFNLKDGMLICKTKPKEKLLIILVKEKIIKRFQEEKLKVNDLK